MGRFAIEILNMKPKTRSLTDKDLNRFERGILKNIQKHGWHANGIPGEGSSPAWTYSVGLFARYGQPELIVFGLEIETMHEMISRYADLLQAGKEYGDGVKIDGIIPGQPCVLREVHVSWREHCSAQPVGTTTTKSIRCWSVFGLIVTAISRGTITATNAVVSLSRCYTNNR